MSYKAILLGILLLLAVPAVSSAVPLELFYQASAAGTNSCNGTPPVVTKVKETLHIGFLFGDVAFEPLNVMGIKDAQDNIVASLVQQQLLYPTDNVLTTGAFMFYGDDGSGNIGAFAGTFKTDANTGILSSFTGTLNLRFQDGCFETLTIKSGAIIQ